MPGSQSGPQPLPSRATGRRQTGCPVKGQCAGGAGRMMAPQSAHPGLVLQTAQLVYSTSHCFPELWQRQAAVEVALYTPVITGSRCSPSPRRPVHPGCRGPKSRAGSLSISTLERHSTWPLRHSSRTACTAACTPSYDSGGLNERRSLHKTRRTDRARRRLQTSIDSKLLARTRAPQICTLSK